ncbi:MAG: glycosyltransferase [Bacilli bacterium]|nr:glycosyltransferase [Bacilli bacterium]MDD4706014.1 glycosyltransferase [Bacilli bacterium]
MKKILISLKTEGMFQTIKKILKFIRYRIVIIINKFNKNIISKEVDINLFKTIIIFENNFGWNKIMKQRPQQIAENLPNDVLMFYHSREKNDYIKGKRIRKLKSNLILIDLGYYRDVLLGELSFHNNKFLMIYSTDFIPISRIKYYQKYNYKVIYEHVDNLDPNLSGKQLYNQFLDRHKKIIKDKNIFIVCTADKLVEEISKYRKNKYQLITNGVNYDFFKYQNYDLPDDLKPIREKYKYIIGYYGALASWFDYKLVKKLSKQKEYAIVLLGLDYDNTIGQSGILNIDNIFYLGKKDYRILPTYGCNFDVCIIPFLINQITLSTSPVKVFEYMAMNRPIVTTALPECTKYKSILFSENEDEFIENVYKAITLNNDKNYHLLLKKEAKENDWKEKAGKLVKFINMEEENVKKNIKKAKIKTK